MFCYCLSNVSGYQLFDHLSDIISQNVQFTNINSCTVTAVQPPPNTYHIIITIGKNDYNYNVQNYFLKCRNTYVCIQEWLVASDSDTVGHCGSKGKEGYKSRE